MIILRDSGYTGQFSADYLVNAGFRVFGKVNNKYVALQIPQDMVNYNIREVVIETKKKPALYKQAMSMQMGRPIREEVDRRRYRFYPIAEKDLKKYRYNIMEAYLV